MSKIYTVKSQNGYINKNSIAFKLAVFIKVHYCINKYQALIVLKFEYPLISKKYSSRIFYSLYTLRKQTNKKTNAQSSRVKYAN